MFRKSRFCALGLILLHSAAFAQVQGVAAIELTSFAGAVSGPVQDQVQDRTPMLRQGRALIAPGQPLFDIAADARRVAVAPSLFADQSEGSLFAPYRARAASVQRRAPLGGSGVEQLRQLIGQAESRIHGYDAVQHGAVIRPDKKPTQMTLAEIFAWIEATPGQPHAIGRYQFIPTTLDWLVGRLGARETAVFDPALQDRLADLLLADAGFQAFRLGRLEQEAFMNNLAQIWAGLPTSDGQSYYHGYAGNRASMTWAEFEAQMTQITW